LVKIYFVTITTIKILFKVDSYLVLLYFRVTGVYEVCLIKYWYMVQYIARGLLSLVFACSCLSVLVIISCFGSMFNYVELPYCLTGAGSGEQT
jgi:hypothetical protein